MSEVLVLRRSAKLHWVPPEGEVLAVHSADQLAAHVAAFRDYGGVTTIHGHSVVGRHVRVTALGEDGWVVKVRDETMAKGGWPCSRVLTRLLADGSFPSHLGDSPWYIPDESTDLAGTVFVAEQVQFSPAVVAQAAWGWVTHGALPNGFGIGDLAYEPVAFADGHDALAWIADTIGRSWPPEAAQATVALLDDLDVDRVIAMNPHQITLRVVGIARRARVLCRPKGSSAQVRVVGMTDGLGHEYSMGLPGREILRIRRGGIGR